AGAKLAVQHSPQGSFACRMRMVRRTYALRLGITLTRKPSGARSPRESSYACPTVFACSPAEDRRLLSAGCPPNAASAPRRVPRLGLTSCCSASLCAYLLDDLLLQLLLHERGPQMVLDHLERWRVHQSVHVAVMDGQHEVLQFAVVFDALDLQSERFALLQVDVPIVRLVA